MTRTSVSFLALLLVASALLSSAKATMPSNARAAGDEWTLVAANSGPVAREGHTGVWDPDQERMLVFGGRGIAGHSSPLNDLWSYRAATGWEEITPNGALGSPPARVHHVAVWDTANDRLLVFGGVSAAFDYGSGVGFLGDLWEWTDLNGWQLLVSEGIAGNPERQFGGSAAWDSLGQRMLMFTGETDTGMCYDNMGHVAPGTRNRKDVWSYSESAGWVKLTPSMTSYCQALPGPTIRIYATAAWDPVAQRLLVFGGWTPGLLHRWDLWAFYPATATWVQLQDIPSIPSTTYDTNRVRHRATWDPSHARMLVFGGVNTERFNDLWAYDGGNGWTRLTTQGAVGSPPPVASPSMAWDTQSSRLLVFGGEAAGNSLSNELWTYGVPDDDADNDGVDNAADACPLMAEDLDGIQDADGCPETDADGDTVLDEADSCPLIAEDPDGIQDADGCPETDADGDTVLDEADSCPLIAEDLDGIRDADGCPETDADGDTVLDEADACPLIAEDLDGIQDADGCPEPNQDSDGDGIDDADDACPASTLTPTVVIGGANTGVPNILLPDGCSIADLIAAAAATATNHGQFVSAVAAVTNMLKDAGYITGAQKGAIQRAAARAAIP
ncbi:MAG: thrombospondin type 3 repeat-containing protein [Dehalococcoidia bacterium]